MSGSEPQWFCRSLPEDRMQGIPIDPSLEFGHRLPERRIHGAQ